MRPYTPDDAQRASEVTAKYPLAHGAPIQIGDPGSLGIKDINQPDYETRLAILQQKARHDEIALGSDVMDFIARACTSSVRELEGAVIKLLAYSSLTNQEITVELARTALKGTFGSHLSSIVDRLTPERIREVVARRFNVRADALSSKRRTRDLTVPRQVAMYLIKRTLDMSLVRIGEHFGGRDHSTVIHSIRKVEEEMARDPSFRHQVESTLAELSETADHSVHRNKWIGGG